MRRVTARRPSGPARAGKYMILLALVLPLLLGMTGLTVDGGTLLAAQRQAQNVADAGALAAAQELFRGNSSGTAIDAATTYVQTHNQLPDARVDVQIPPLHGPYTGNA